MPLEKGTDRLTQGCHKLPIRYKHSTAPVRGNKEELRCDQREDMTQHPVPVNMWRMTDWVKTPKRI